MLYISYLIIFSDSVQESISSNGFNDILLYFCCVIQKILVILQRKNRGKSACEKKKYKERKTSWHDRRKYKR